MSEHDPNPFAPPSSMPAQGGFEGGPPLARRLTRLVAVIIDGAIMLAVTIPVFLGFGVNQGPPDTFSIVGFVGQLLFGIVVYLAIHGYLLATRGQSVGKYLLGIKIVDAESYEILDFGKLVGLRIVPVWLVSAIPIIGGLLAMVDALFIFQENRRCVHDLIAGTIVVEA